MSFFEKLKRKFSYTRNEVLACYVLIIIIIISLFVKHYVWIKQQENRTEKSLMIREENFLQDSIVQGKQLHLYEFNPNTIDSIGMDSLDIPKAIKRNMLKYREKGGKFRTSSDVRKIYGMTDSIYQAIAHLIIILPDDKSDNQLRSHKKTDSQAQTRNFDLKLFDFNPNTVSESQLDSLDFPSNIKRNLIKYRNKGGFFKHATDLKKLYGMTDELFLRIEPFIILPEVEHNLSTPNRKETTQIVASLELNSCTADELEKLQGIGSVLAKRIVAYRDLLGGYAQTEQLNQVYGLPKETVELNSSKLICDTSLIKKIKLNFATQNELAKHPLIGNEKAKTIIKLRAKIGSIQNLSTLNGNVFTNDEYKLLVHYFEI